MIKDAEDEEFDAIYKKQQQSNWKGLTSEEKYKLFHSPLSLMALIEEIEYKLKQKNT